MTITTVGEFTLVTVTAVMVTVMPAFHWQA